MTAIQNLDQQPKYQADQLIAAHATPNSPVVSDATLPTSEEMQGNDLPENTIAQLPDLGKMVRDTGEAIVHPHSGDLNKFLDVEAAKLAMNKFPRLSRYANNYASIRPQLILGLIRNETEHYTRFKDDLIQDGLLSIGWKAQGSDDPTTGPAQVSESNQERLAKKYPEILGNSRDYPKASLSPYFATLLVGAYLDNTIETFEKWDKQPPSEIELKDKNTRLLYEHAYPQWQEGHFTEALIRSYNPGDGARHVRNVQRHINALTGAN